MTDTYYEIDTFFEIVRDRVDKRARQEAAFRAAEVAALNRLREVHDVMGRYAGGIRELGWTAEHCLKANHAELMFNRPNHFSVGIRVEAGTGGRMAIVSVLPDSLQSKEEYSPTTLTDAAVEGLIQQTILDHISG